MRKTREYRRSSLFKVPGRYAGNLGENVLKRDDVIRRGSRASHWSSAFESLVVIGRPWLSVRRKNARSAVGGATCLVQIVPFVLSCLEESSLEQKGNAPNAAVVIALISGCGKIPENNTPLGKRILSSL